MNFYTKEKKLSQSECKKMPTGSHFTSRFKIDCDNKMRECSKRLNKASRY